MALQDLTPELRTRMNRAERWVGLFVMLAALLTFAGFTYYLIKSGKSRGWFIDKIPYYCYTKDATGLKVGDPVRLLGREVGRIVKIDTLPPDPWFLNNNYNVFVKFEVWDPYFEYILTDSRVKLLSADFFGSRYLEVTRGDPDTGIATIIKHPDFAESQLLNDKAKPYPSATDRVALRAVKEGVWLYTDEAPTMAQRAEAIVHALADAIPGLTNRVAEVLVQAGEASSNANRALSELRPTLANVALMTERLNSEPGAIGRMLLPTNLETRVESTLISMDSTLTNTTALIRASETQLQDLTRRIALTLDAVAVVTSNLSVQVNANGMFLGEVASLVAGADDMVEGLKRHWLLRSAFAGRTNPPIESIVLPSIDAPRP